MVVRRSRCHWCDQQYEPSSNTSGKPQKYCSARCRRAAAGAAWRARERAAVSRPTECAECGLPIVQPASGRPRRFCSDKCRIRVGGRRTRRARPPRPKEYPRTCPECGKDFIATRANRVYCYDSYPNGTSRCGVSAAQRGKSQPMGTHEVECDNCGKKFTSQHPKARWCSRTCAKQHWNRIDSRRRGPLPKSKPYTDREIFIRDHWRCLICGKPTRRSAKWPHALSPTIDHVVPLSRGGPDEPSNIVTAHWRCNREKRNQ